MRANKACTGRWGFCAIYKHFSGFEFSLLPNRVHARPSAMLRECKPLGGGRNGVTHMILPDYWLTRPNENFDEGTQIAFDELLKTTLSIGGCPTIQFTLPWSKWQFLCHIADHHDIALHGSSDPNIALFEPRQSNDLNEFGN